MPIKRLLQKGLAKLFSTTVQRGTEPLLSKIAAAQGEIASLQVRSLETIRSLADVEFSISSQWGEDGIIEWLVHHYGPMPESFVEFGVESYREANTRFLLKHRNWSGLIIDGSADNIAIARSDEISWRYDLKAKAAFITADNINALIGDSGFSGELGILSVDIDGNDYWVWDAINCVKPHIVIAEYNAVFGDKLPLSVPYDASFMRGKAHYSNLYYGASIAALTQLAEKKGYILMGSNSAGSNAFFVRRDRAALFEHRIADKAPRVSRFRESRAPDGTLTMKSGAERLKEIAALPVANTESGVVAPLSSFGPLYSERWLACMRGQEN